MIKVFRHTEGDTRVAENVPTIEQFGEANRSHLRDVENLARTFSEQLKQQVSVHDWTKVQEPYRSMFYRDLCDTIEGKMDFVDGEWYKLHCKIERHHLNEYCPEDVNMYDVIEMICDCVAAGMARHGDVHDVFISEEVLKKAVANTVTLLKDEITLIG